MLQSDGSWPGVQNLSSNWDGRIYDTPCISHHSVMGSGTFKRPNQETSEQEAVPAKRRYRRHPKPDSNAPEKPPSAYLIFSNKIRESVRGLPLSFTEIAKHVGQRWQALAVEERESYELHANRLRQKYVAELTEYKKTPEFAEYQKYLEKFRASSRISNFGMRAKPQRYAPTGSRESLLTSLNWDHGDHFTEPYGDGAENDDYGSVSRKSSIQLNPFKLNECGIDGTGSQFQSYRETQSGGLMRDLGQGRQLPGSRAGGLTCKGCGGYNTGVFSGGLGGSEVDSSPSSTTSAASLGTTLTSSSDSSGRSNSLSWPPFIDFQNVAVDHSSKLAGILKHPVQSSVEDYPVIGRPGDTLTGFPPITTLSGRRIYHFGRGQSELVEGRNESLIRARSSSQGNICLKVGASPSTTERSRFAGEVLRDAKSLDGLERDLLVLPPMDPIRIPRGRMAGEVETGSGEGTGANPGGDSGGFHGGISDRRSGEISGEVGGVTSRKYGGGESGADGTTTKLIGLVSHEHLSKNQCPERGRILTRGESSMSGANLISGNRSGSIDATPQSEEMGSPNARRERQRAEPVSRTGGEPGQGLEIEEDWQSRNLDQISNTQGPDYAQYPNMPGGRPEALMGREDQRPCLPSLSSLCLPSPDCGRNLALVPGVGRCCTDSGGRGEPSSQSERGRWR